MRLSQLARCHALRARAAAPAPPRLGPAPPAPAPRPRGSSPARGTSPRADPPGPLAGFRLADACGEQPDYCDCPPLWDRLALPVRRESMPLHVLPESLRHAGGRHWGAAERHMPSHIGIGMVVFTCLA